jgi:hypothetical protein
LRRRQPIYDGGIATLQVQDVKEVRAGVECGIKLGDFTEYKLATSSSAIISKSGTTVVTRPFVRS